MNILVIVQVSVAASWHWRYTSAWIFQRCSIVDKSPWKALLVHLWRMETVLSAHVVAAAEIHTWASPVSGYSELISRDISSSHIETYAQILYHTSLANALLHYCTVYGWSPWIVDPIPHVVDECLQEFVLVCTCLYDELARDFIIKKRLLMLCSHLGA